MFRAALGDNAQLRQRLGLEDEAPTTVELGFDRLAAIDGDRDHDPVRQSQPEWQLDAVPTRRQIDVGRGAWTNGEQAVGNVAIKLDLLDGFDLVKRRVRAIAGSRRERQRHASYRTIVRVGRHYVVFSLLLDCTVEPMRRPVDPRLKGATTFRSDIQHIVAGAVFDLGLY